MRSTQENMVELAEIIGVTLLLILLGVAILALVIFVETRKL